MNRCDRRREKRGRRWLAACLVAAVLLPTVGSGQTPAEVDRGRRAYREAVEAYRAERYGEMIEPLERARAMRPNHPAILYALAAARARNGEPGPALEHLRALADMGLAYDPEREADFAALVDEPGFADVAVRLRDNAGPTGTADTAYTLPWRDFVPEGIARDPRDGSAYVSSVRYGRIARIDSRGDVSVFADVESRSAFGMAIDLERGILWVGTAAIEQTADVDPAELGRGAVVGFDLGSGDEVARHVVAGDDRDHVPGDLTLASDGTLYVSDAAAGSILVLRPDGDALESVVPPGGFASPQGSALSADGSTLYVADYARGVVAVDLTDGSTDVLDGPDDLTALGIDGLVRHGDALIAVQNGVRPARVLVFDLDPSGHAITGWRVLAGGLAAFEEPTLGTVAAGRFLLVANSHWDRFEGGELVGAEDLSPPLVLALDLEF